MSGVLSALGTVNAVANLGQAITNLLFGGASNPVTLGSFIFQSFEVPERINWGGTQKVIVHCMLGGDRQIDRMGWEPEPLTWSGVMIGPDAQDRASALQKLASDGEEQELSFGAYDYLVVVTRFRAEQFKKYHVFYRVECTVIADNSAILLADSEPTFLDRINDDVSSALGFNVGATLSAAQQTIQQGITAVQPVLAATSALFPGSKALLGITMGLSTAQTAISTAGAAAGTLVGTINSAASGVSNLLGQTTIAGALQQFPLVSSATATLAGAAMSGAYVNRAATNATNWTSGDGTSNTSSVNRFIPSGT